MNLCGCLGYGEHSGNRQLRRSVSLLLSPPFSPPAHLYLPPPSPLHLTCEPLWVSLTGENLFTINLEVLLSVLYSWRSLETTGRINLKSRDRRLKPQTWENEKNSWLHGTLSNKRPSKNLHTYTETNHHPRANKFQSKTYHANSPTTQEHSPERQHTGCPRSHLIHRPISKLITGHSIALQREEI